MGDVSDIKLHGVRLDQGLLHPNRKSSQPSNVCCIQKGLNGQFYIDAFRDRRLQSVEVRIDEYQAIDLRVGSLVR